MALSVNSFSAANATLEIYSKPGGGESADLRFVTAREIVIVSPRMATIMRSEIQFGIGKRRATIIFVPTKKRMRGSPGLREMKKSIIRARGKESERRPRNAQKFDG